MEYCTYCHEPRMDRTGCCGENHWTEYPDDTEIELLEAKLLQIEKDQEHWKSCQDGSYEVSLAMAGYDKIANRIKELKNA